MRSPYVCPTGTAVHFCSQRSIDYCFYFFPINVVVVGVVVVVVVILVVVVVEVLLLLFFLLMLLSFFLSFLFQFLLLSIVVVVVIVNSKQRMANIDTRPFFIRPEMDLQEAIWIRHAFHIQLFRCVLCISIRGYVCWSVGPSVGPLVKINANLQNYMKLYENT